MVGMSIVLTAMRKGLLLIGSCLGVPHTFSSLKQIAGIENGPISEAFKPEFFKLVLGTLSLPINLPGTNYRKGIQARKKIVGILRQLIEERRGSTSAKDDILDSLVRTDGNSRFGLNDEQIVDLIISIVYSGYETVSTTSMMAVKYLHDHPRALDELRKEHLTIRKGKDPMVAVDWDDYKSMNFTRAVIFETMRISTIVNGVLRKTTEEMKIKGFIIPKGWKIYVYMRETNYDPFHYPDPLTFNPWRWLDKSLETRQNFMMFGGGSRLCPGKELGIVEIFVFLHYFVTSYRSLRLQLEAFFTFVLFRIVANGNNPQLQEVAVEGIINFCRQPTFTIEAYVNYWRPGLVSLRIGSQPQGNCRKELSP